MKMQENLKKDHEMRSFIQNIEKSKPYVDPMFGAMWGTDSERKKETKSNAKVSKT